MTYRIVGAPRWGYQLERWNGAIWCFVMQGSGGQVRHSYECAMRAINQPAQPHAP